MIINTANLDGLRKGFHTAFKQGLGQSTSQYGRVATTVPSSTRSNTYGWLGKIPSMREWIGPRVVQGLSEHSYSIENKSFELTIGVDRDDISDDNLGIYAPLFTEMGESTEANPDLLTFGLLNKGFAELCFDGQNYFDTDHPMLDEKGNEVTYTNTAGGANTPWFMMSTKRFLKPLIFQERKKPEFVARDKINDSNVFDLKEYRYGVDSRCNVGFGLPQMAFGSKQTLNKDNFKDARENMMGLKGDGGRPLGLMPDLLVVPPSLEDQALEIIHAERDAAGATNVYKGTAEILVVPWLS